MKKLNPVANYTCSLLCTKFANKKIILLNDLILIGSTLETRVGNS